MNSDTIPEVTIQPLQSTEAPLLATELISPVLSAPLVGLFTFESVVLTFFTILLLAIGSIFGFLMLREIYRALVIAVNRPIDASAVPGASGAVELEGTAQLLDDSDDESRIAYKRERQKKETERDSDGNKEENWKTVSTSEDASPFRLADESGSVVVDPDGANLSIDMERTKSTSRRRTYRGSITPGDTVHIYGNKLSASDTEEPPGDAEVFVGDGDGQFLISDTTQFRTALRYLFSGVKYSLFTFVALGFGLVIGLITLDLLFGFNPVGI